MTNTDPRENPEYYLWVYHGDDVFMTVEDPIITFTTPEEGRFITALSSDRLQDLLCGAEPRNRIEKRLADNPSWINFWFDTICGNVPIHIEADGPLP